jgi:hypothetical protein
VEGTVIRLQVARLPGRQNPTPLWLWWSKTGATPAEVDRCWQAFLRRFDLEHNAAVPIMRRGRRASWLRG